MERSKIEQLIHGALVTFGQHGITLPPFAFWTPPELERKGPEVKRIIQTNCGWDITDFGSGEFHRRGLLLFTARNGLLHNDHLVAGTPYAEKWMIVDGMQETPFHCHPKKFEDIGNWGGGELYFQLAHSERVVCSDGSVEYVLDPAVFYPTVEVSIDGVLVTVNAMERFALQPGQSITLPAGLFHCFYAEKDKRVVVHEVSKVNDDHTDNVFHDPCVGRFPMIDEDRVARYLLVGDYQRYYGYYAECFIKA